MHCHMAAQQEQDTFDVIGEQLQVLLDHATFGYLSKDQGQRDAAQLAAAACAQQVLDLQASPVTKLESVKGWIDNELLQYTNAFETCINVLLSTPQVQAYISAEPHPAAGKVSVGQWVAAHKLAQMCTVRKTHSEQDPVIAVA